MAHLFFDSPTYPWHVPEASRLWRLLYELFDRFDEIDLIRKQCGSDIPPFADRAADLMWQEMLDNVAFAGRLRELDRELRLGPSPGLRDALDLLISAVSPDPVTWVLDDPIFANRLGLRAALAQLASPKSAKTVLVVRGDRQSGKTWTKHFVEHYARIGGMGCTYMCEGMISTVDEAVSGIFSELGGEPPPRLTTDAAWYTRVAHTMVKAAQERRKGSWLIMDDLGNGPDNVPLVEPEIRKLFEQLALNMLNPAFREWFKLVLISYPGDQLPSKWRQCSLEDRTTGADMHAGALAEFLCNWAQRHSKTLADSDARAFAELIHSRAASPADAADTRSHMERVHDELVLVLGRL